MASWLRSLPLPLFLCSLLLLNHSVKCDHGDEDDHLLQSLNAYRAALNLTALVKNDNAECLADKVAEQFQHQPCTNTTGANTVPGTEPQFANYPTLLTKCHLNVSNTRDGVVLPACVPNLDSSLVLTNFTRSQYSDYLNDTKFSGIGIGSENNWVVVVLTTSTPEGSFVPAQNSVDTGNSVNIANFSNGVHLHCFRADNDEEDILLKGINAHRASLKLTQLIENDKAECFADEFADRFQDQPCTNTTGSIIAPGVQPRFRLSHYPQLLAKCNLSVTNTTDGVVLPICVPRSVPSLALSDIKRSRYSDYLNDTKFNVAGIGSEDDWFVVVLTSNAVVGSPVPAGRTPNIPITPNTANASNPIDKANVVDTVNTVTTENFAPMISFTYHSLYFLIASILLL
ncbi:hypothetical protein TorRG33x02_020260 [Trema orientale]|uniref:Uncharacterized GPI-anchored protein At5g19230-like domain-containing protein n=1 Tax=Trema orientale TaxID=63057 RepID=A0A2P5FWT2_TREOI|nr:hypothetical protein TorRG33x02_020260 [Trema orientale]